MRRGRWSVAPDDPVADLRKRASLLRTDSIHGAFNATIEVDEDNLALIATATAFPSSAPRPAISTTAGRGSAMPS